MIAVKTKNSWAKGTVLALVLAVLPSPPIADAQTDFAPRSAAWNGLRELMGIAERAAAHVSAPEELRLDTLTPDDALLILEPAEAPPRPDLAAFLREGGRLAIADDYGAADRFLTPFEIGRTELPGDLAPLRLRGNRNVLIATPRALHPLTEGVSALVVNHPRVLHHRELDTLFAVGRGGDARDGTVLLAGAVGAGRLVVLSDPSALINNMLEFRGNRRFARNLLEYLAEGRRLYVLTPDARLTGRYPGAERAPGIGRLREALAQLATPDLPPTAVGILAAAITAVLLFVAATALPRRSAFGRSLTAQGVDTVAGLAGRVRYYRQTGRNLLPPLMTYRLELESALSRRLGVSGQASADALADALLTRGVDATVAQDARALLRELEALSLSQQRPAAPPKVSPRRFRAMVSRGDRILADLDAPRDQA
jgi:hypothetical protein